MEPKYIPGIFATRSDYAPAQLVTNLKIDLELLTEFLRKYPEVVENNKLQMTIWTDEKGIHYATVDKKRTHPGHFDPENYEQPHP